MMVRHMTIEQLSYGKPVQSRLKDCYGETEANQIWEQTQQNYKYYLLDEQGFLVSRKRLPENIGG